MKTIKITETAWKGLSYLKTKNGDKTYSDTIIRVIHTAITNIYIDMDESNIKEEPEEIKELEKIIGWKRQ